MKTPDTIKVDGREFYFYREHFPFGDFPGYRTFGDTELAYRFIESGEIVTPTELADRLSANYVQQSESGIREAMDRYQGLRTLPA